MESALNIDLPREMWQLICSHLSREVLCTVLIRLNKTFYALAVCELAHRPRLRLVDNTLRIVVAGPANSGKSLLVSTLVNEHRTSDRRAVFIRSRALDSVSRQGSRRHLTFVDVPAANRILTHSLLKYAAASEALLLVVNAHEISTSAPTFDTVARHVSTLVFGTCFAMSSRDLVVAVNLHGEHVPRGAGQHLFEDAKRNLTRVIASSFAACPDWQVSEGGVYCEFVPVNVKQNVNLTPVSMCFTWYNGADLLTVLARNQLRSHYDDSVIQRLARARLYCPLLSAHRVPGIGTVACGIVLSGTLRSSDSVLISPSVHYPASLLSLERHREYVYPIGPGDAPGITIRYMSHKELHPRVGLITQHPPRNPLMAVLAFRVRLTVLGALTVRQSYRVVYGTAQFSCLCAWKFPSDAASTDAILLPFVHFPVEPYRASDVQKNLRGRIMLLECGACVAVGRIERVLRGSKPYELPQRADFLAQYNQVRAHPEELFSVNEELLQQQFMNDMTCIEHVMATRQNPNV